MAQRYTQDDQNHVDVFTEEERARSAEKSASLVQGWTEYGPFEGDSIEEVIANAKDAISEAEARQAELGDIKGYVAERRARITICEKIKSGQLKGRQLKF